MVENTRRAPQANVDSMLDSHGHHKLQQQRETSPHRKKVSGSFIVECFLVSMCVAYASGRVARMLWIEGPRRGIMAEYNRRRVIVRDGRRAIVRDVRNGANPSYYHPPLPLIVTAKDGEPIPHTRYISKNFDTGRSIYSSSWYMTHNDACRRVERDVTESESGISNVHGDGKDDNESKEEEDEYDGDEESQPVAEHLMVDIKNVDTAFLDSEHLLVQAMLDLAEEAQVNLLSYQCHAFSPAGVSCVGLLLQNHVAFHTWPIEGVITFDLCTSRSKTILPLISSIERLFGIPRVASFPGQVIEQPEIRWTHKIRGFYNTPTEISNLFLSSDLRPTLLDHPVELKEEVTSIQTKFQRINIYDILDLNADRGSHLSRYRKSLSNDGSYEAMHPFEFRPNRVLFLDGWLQSSRDYEAAYHEALVHPALFAHPNPKRVAIIGGGEGATLREVLKHKTVEEAVMIEIDEIMVNASREHIPEWSDCSDFIGSAPWCIDDPRATEYYEDALEWFMTRYSHEKRFEQHFDVIILDALDPESEIPFAEALYSNDQFMQAFFDSLSENGILVMQLGEAPEYNSPDETYSRYKNRAATTKLLENLGFGSIHTYEESHCGFYAPWTYVIGFKSHGTRDRWYRSPSEIDLEVRKRSVPTKSGTSPFRYFDGATMLSYQIPHRVVEAVYCRRQPKPKECECWYDSKWRDVWTRLLTTGDSDEIGAGKRGDTFKYNPVAERHLRQEGRRSFRDIFAHIERM